MSEPIVRIETGEIRGRSGTDLNGNDFHQFQGIPYGKPPIGELRFRSPQPAEPWTGVRDCREEGNACIARHSILNTIIGDEDCLVLNVYTPAVPQDANAKKKPVMFWIHGGGFTSGSSSTEVYGPEYLVSGDVVLVTINYRLGIFGFLQLEDPDLNVSGNAGLKDIVVALKWVQTNIGQFGGDRNNVTIFGESAGGAAAHYLMLSPRTKGLFHKAILQSGTALHLWAIGTKCASTMGNILKLKTTDQRKILNAMQNLSGEELYKSSEQMEDQRPVGPVIERYSDDALIWEHPIDIIKSGNYNQIPILLGYTNREGILSEVLDKPKPFKPITDFRLTVPFVFNIKENKALVDTIGNKVKKFYYGNEEPTTVNKDNFFVMQSDNFFIREVLHTVEYHLQTLKHPMYLYRMSYDTSLNMLKVVYNITDPGACHADDLGYLFRNVLSDDLEPGSVEEVGIRRFVTFWTNFAKTGNPNPAKLDKLINVKWKPVTQKETNIIDIGPELKVDVNPEAERMAFWKEIHQMANPRAKL